MHPDNLYLDPLEGLTVQVSFDNSFACNQKKTMETSANLNNNYA